MKGCDSAVAFIGVDYIGHVRLLARIDACLSAGMRSQPRDRWRPPHADGFHQYSLTFRTDLRHKLFTSSEVIDLVFVQILRAANAQVELALLPCYRPVPRSAGYWPERGDDTRTRHVNTLLDQEALRFPDTVHTLQPPSQFCTNPTIAKSLSYRWDGVHYYKPGAALYFKAILPQLVQL